MSSHKMIPLTREEVFLLIGLVESHAEVTSRATSASDNAEKQEAWKKITAKFNAKVKSGPRKPGQLRLKWENLKKAARKRTANRMLDMKIENGQADYCRPDVALDRVNSILGVTREVPDRRQSSLGPETRDTFTGDIKVEVEVKEHPIPKKPRTSPVSPATGCSVDNVRRRMYLEYTRSRTVRNLAIAEYYKIKTQKIELEIEKIKNEKSKNVHTK